MWEYYGLGLLFGFGYLIGFAAGQDYERRQHGR